jgi:heptosyltransferase-1
MGDVLHALPAVAALRERLPDCFIGWAVEPRWRALLDAPESHLSRNEAATKMGHIVDKVHAVPAREWKRRPLSVATLREIAALRREMQAEKYDVCVDLQGAIKSAVIGRMAQARHFVGPRKPRERQARALYGERVDVRSKHVIEQACELVKAGLAAMVEEWQPVQGLAPARVTIPADASAESWCDELLAGLEIGEQGFCLLAPTAGWGAKQWQPERYAELARRLAAQGYRVLVNGGSGAEREMLGRLAEASGATVVESDIPQLIALTRRARLTVGGDTGPVHLAAALGGRVLALFGPTDPGRNGPYFLGAKVRVLRHAESRLDHARHGNTEAGLAKITEDEVVAAAFQLLREPVLVEINEGVANG